jgi:predicted Zn-dependent protease with MMP-like domain
MSMRRFGRLVAIVMRTLPPEFEPYIQNLVVDVQSEPDEETLRLAGFTEEEIAAGESLFGLYVPGTTAEYESGVSMPDRILIFRDPLEDEFPDPKQLRIEIRKTVVHELSHHFGFNEEDIAPFDAKEDPFAGHEDA